MQNLFFSTALITLLLSLPAGDRNPGSPYLPGADTTGISLGSTKWNLVKIHSATGTIEVANRNTFIRFDREKGKAGGKGGCNSFGATLTITGKTIRITDVFSTKMYCQEVQVTEDLFLSLLPTATAYEINGNTLLLLTGKKVVLELEQEN